MGNQRVRSSSVCLQGEGGDVSTSLSPTFPDVSSWLPPNFLSYVHTPGHAPGHVSYIHKPTSSLIAGDVLFRITSSPSLQHPLSFLTPNLTLVKVRKEGNLLTRGSQQS